MATATLHEISGGRVGYLGLGVGYRSRTETYFGISIERPLQRMRESVEIIRLLLSGQDASHEGSAASVIYSVSDSPEEAAAAAKEDVLFYLGYPEINPILEQSGLMEAAEAIRSAHRGRGNEAVLDLIDTPMLDALAVYGGAERCRARLKELMAAGIDLPIIRVSNLLYPEADKKRVFLRAIESLQGF